MTLAITTHQLNIVAEVLISLLEGWQNLIATQQQMGLGLSQARIHHLSETLDALREQ